MLRKRSLAALLLAVALPLSAAATDYVIQVQSQFTVKPTCIDGNFGTTAVGASNAAGTASAVVVHRIAGDARYVHLVTGSVQRVDVSHDGVYMLVEHVVSQVKKTTLFVIGGGQLWVKTDPRRFEFSTTGQSIVAWQPGTSPIDHLVTVYSIAGTETWNVELDHPALPAYAAVVAVGAGDRVVVAVGGSLRCIKSDGSEPWSFDVGRHELPFRDLRPLDATRIASVQWLGDPKVFIGMTGDDVYSHSRGSFEAPRADRSWAPHSLDLPHAMPDGRILMYAEGQADALLVDPAASTVVDAAVDVVKPGYTLAKGVHGAKLVFIAAGSVVVRTL